MISDEGGIPARASGAMALVAKLVEMTEAHPNPYEAEAACGAALAIASCRVKMWPFRGGRSFLGVRTAPSPDTTPAGHSPA
jgi:hypothetical protein